MGVFGRKIVEALEGEAFALYREGVSYEDAVKFLFLKTLNRLANLGLPPLPPSTEKQVEDEVRLIVARVWQTAARDFCRVVQKKLGSWNARGLTPKGCYVPVPHKMK